VTIANVMTRELPIVAPQDKLGKAAREMTSANVKALPVCERERLVGIITDWDVTRAVATDGDAADQPVDAYMSKDVISVAPDATYMEAAEELAAHEIHHLLVCEEGCFRGMVHMDVEWSELGGLETPIATFTAPI
jgi:CBS domain-containing protein